MRTSAFLIRALDVVGAVLGIILTAPIMLIASAAIWAESGRPILFFQTRIGQNNVPFTIVKFRTMRVGTPQVAKDKLAANLNTSVTEVGKVLRRTSIDELPQLFNVLRGEMSLVGPRPALHNQADLISMRTERGVHQLKPGITGLAQVNGREDMPLSRKVEYDAELLRTLGPVTYVLVVLRTVGVVFRSRGTY